MPVSSLHGGYRGPCAPSAVAGVYSTGVTCRVYGVDLRTGNSLHGSVVAGPSRRSFAPIASTAAAR